MEALIQNLQNSQHCKIILVISNKEEAPGLERTEKLGIQSACIPSGKTFDDDLLSVLEKHNVNFIALAGFNRILSPKIVAQYQKKIVNIHPADTKLYKGLHGYKWAFETERKETTVTVHYVDEGVDTGEIIAQAPVNLQGTTTLEEVEQRGLKIEHALYSQTLKKLFGGSHVRSLCSH